MVKVVSPYFNIELYEQIILLPKYLNNNLYNNLLTELKRKVENKCNTKVYINKIHKIIEYNNGIMEPENFTGSVKYNVKYIANICNPLKDTNIICQIKNINKLLLKAEYGPIILIIKTSEINRSIFKIFEGDIINIKNKKKLEIDDYIIIKILDKKLSHNDTRICTIGYLERLATVDEIKEYM